MPLWDKALINKIPHENSLSTELTSNESEDTSTTTIVLIPVVHNNSIDVNAVFACLIENDSISIKFYSKGNYFQFGYSNSTNVNAQKVAGLLMYIQNKLFGTSSFVVRDTNLFKNPNSTNTNELRIIQFKVQQDNSNPEQTIINLNSSNQISVCYYYQVPCCRGTLCSHPQKTYVPEVVCNYFWIQNSTAEPPGSGVGSGGGTGGGQSGSGGAGGGGMDDPFQSVQTTLTNLLGLNTAQESFLWQNNAMAEQMLTYYGMSDGVFTIAEKRINLLNHLQLLMHSPSYLNNSISVYNMHISYGWGWSTLWFNQLAIEGTEPILYSNIQNLKLMPQQAYYLFNNSTISTQIQQYYTLNNNFISKVLLKSSIDIALKGQNFQLPNIAIDYSANNNVNRVVVNLLENDCLEQVFTKITSQGYTNWLSDMIRQFDANENVTIIMREDNTLGDGVFGRCKGEIDENYNLKYYLITLNPTALSGASEERIADVMFHKFIHAYLKENLGRWDWANSTEHNEILFKYLSKLASTLNETFGTNVKDAYCIAYSSLFDDESPIEMAQSALARSRIKQILLNQFNNDPIFANDESMEAVANQYLAGGSKGVRTGNCQ